MSQAGDVQDAVDLITSDHRMVATLFEQLKAATTAQERQELGEQIICDLSIHAAVEEQLLYPRARKLLGDDSLVDHAIEEHGQLKQVLDRLDGKGPDDDGFMSRVHGGRAAGAGARQRGRDAAAASAAGGRERR